MVLEALIGPKGAEKRPMRMFFLGMLYASIAVVLSIWIFKQQASLIMVFLTVLACVPLIYKTVKLEEEKDLEFGDETRLLEEHGKALSYFMFLFFGFIVAFALWFVFLPAESMQNLFSIQLKTIESINASILGKSISSSVFMKILVNNLKVLLFCIFFSFFYGAGAIFILTWNASVISGAIGNFIRNNLSEYASSIGLLKVGGYFHIFSIGIMRYMTHGVFEILAYFIGGLAGGIISVAVIRHDIESESFKKVLYDSLDLVLLAVLALIVAALIEVYITPALF